MASESTATAGRVWTSEQLRGIRTGGGNLLVSAAAGSGKTAVLAERCAYLVCDGPSRCNVDELLVVTFTKAAAAEMRDRIEQALRGRLDSVTGDEHERLIRQMASLERATIGTLHSFCATVLREHFHLLDLDPGFTLLDEDATRLLRLETARELFTRMYDSPQAAAFERFVDEYGEGDDERLIRRVLATDALLSSVVDPRGWLERARQQIAEGAQGSLADSALGRQLAEIIGEWLAGLRRDVIALATEFAPIAGLEPYAEYVNEILAAVESWGDAFAQKGVDALSAAIGGYKCANLPRFKKPPPEKEAAQKKINALREGIGDGTIGKLCRFTTGQWQQGLARTIEPTNTFLDLVDQFTQAFTTAKRQERALDFSDLERLTLKVLHDGDAASKVARAYHQRYRHVMVDEYQDINEVQDAILSLVSRSGREANLFCVGDVKQSIYRFRLAEPRRFLGRLETYGREKPINGGLVIDLRTSFRSHPVLIDCLNGLFERLMTRLTAEVEYDESHRLRPPEPLTKAPGFGDGPPVEVIVVADETTSEPPEECEEDDEEFDRTEREAAVVAKRIGELLGRDGKPPAMMHVRGPNGQFDRRPAQLKDVAVLLRSMVRKAEHFAAVLRREGIAVHSDSTTGFFEAMEVRDVLALLAVLDNAQQDVPLAAVLRSPLLAVAHPEDAMMAARVAYPDSREAPVPFHEAVRRFAEASEEEHGRHLRAALRQLDEWRTLAQRRPLPEVLWTIFEQSGYLAFCAGLNEGDQRVANLLDLHARAGQFANYQRQGLGRFCAFLDSLRDEGDLGQPSLSGGGEDAVRIMSVHRAKGLEFPIVFVPDLGKKHNLKECAGNVLVGREAYVGLTVADERLRVRYPSLAYAMARETLKRQTLAEELRVLYVAMTRAKEKLVLIGTGKADAIDGWTQRWSEHGGALPGDVFLNGRAPLDWVGPAAAMVAAGSGKLIDLKVVDPATLKPAPRRGEVTDERLAQLQPLQPPPPRHAEADAVIERLSRPYPFAVFTQERATRPVHDAVQFPAETHAGFDEVRTSRSAAPGVAATDRGEATHVLLQHLKFEDDCDLKAIGALRDDLVNRRLIAKDAAAAIDLQSVCWFLETPLGKLMRSNARLLLREVPIYLPQEIEGAASKDPADRVMIRGRIDALLPLPGRPMLIDYKTDRVNEAQVAARAEVYRGQLDLYRQAIQSMMGTPVEAHLVFFTPRLCRVL